MGHQWQVLVLKDFFKIIKVAFMQKRKTLVNALVNGGIIKNREEAEKMLGKLGIDVKIRGERLCIFNGILVI